MCLESLKLRIPKPEMEFLIKVLETKGFKENMESGFLEPETVIFESIEANVYFSCAKEQTSKKKYFCISMKNTELYCCIGSITRQLEFDELTFNENLKCFTFNDPYSWKYGQFYFSKFLSVRQFFQFKQKNHEIF